jgi:arylsulfatase A-like enzyme
MADDLDPLPLPSNLGMVSDCREYTEGADTMLARNTPRFLAVALLLGGIACERQVEIPFVDLLARLPDHSGVVAVAGSGAFPTGGPLEIAGGEEVSFRVPRCAAPHLVLTWQQETAEAELDILVGGAPITRLSVGGSDIRIDLGAGHAQSWTIGLRASGGGIRLLKALIRDSVPQSPAGALRDGLIQPNVLLLIIDTLRADHLGCYGATQPTTSGLDQAAATGVLYEDATSQANGTLPSISSILSGVYPYKHGVYDNSTYLEQGWLTLPELLKENGYSTAAMVGAYHLNPNISGYGDGFDYFDRCQKLKCPADDVVDTAIRWLEHHRDDRFFVLVHLFDPHTPYTPPDSIAQRYYQGDPRDPENKSMEDASWLPGQEAYLNGWLKGITDLNYPLALYAAEVDFAAQQASRLFRWLEENDLTNLTLAVVTADHGESLTEHDIYLGHAGLYQQVVHVPLFLTLPGVLPEGRRVSEPVENFAIYPTIAKLLHIESPTDVMTPALPVETLPGNERRIVSEAGFRGGMVVREGPWKLISTFRNNYTIRTGNSLYDLSRDREEKENIVRREKRIAQRLKKRVATLLKDRRSRQDDETVPVDPKHKEMLEALGYVE